VNLPGSVEFGDDEPCGCDSGKRYEACCKGLRARYIRKPSGAVFREVLIPPEAVDTLQEVERRFRETFGRKPQGREKIFHSIAYQKSSDDFFREFQEIANAANISKHLIYAHKKLDGLMLTEETYRSASAKDREEWDEAVGEYLDAEELGIDLLEPQTPSEIAVATFASFLADIVSHIGSYADRSPRKAKRDTTLFFQFLLIARVHQSVKSILDGWGRFTDTELAVFLRSAYESTLLVGRLNVNRDYSETIVAQSLLGSDLFEYRIKNNGTTDFSTIVGRLDKREYQARHSFAECARLIGKDDEDVFQIIYPELSRSVHFNALDMIQRYRKHGEFLTWDKRKQDSQLVKILVVILYFVRMFHGIDGLPKVLERDAKFLHRRAMKFLLRAYSAFDEDDVEVAPIDSILMFMALHDFAPPRR
jgi:hypothetical protein